MRLHIPPEPSTSFPESDSQPIMGIFDSGIGGLAVMKELIQLLPTANLYYFADQAHAPYGNRSFREIAEYSRFIAEELFRHGAEALVLACNTASATALYELRERFPEKKIVGMEPAVKPAAANSLKGRIGVIATQLTLSGRPYAGVLQKFASSVEVHTAACPEFVELVEAGELNSPQTASIIENKLRPLLDQGIDQLVLGCTHYSFLKPLIAKICSPRVTVVDPAQAVARQAAKVWRCNITNADSGSPAYPRLFTSEAKRLRELQSIAESLLRTKVRTQAAAWG